MVLTLIVFNKWCLTLFTPWICNAGYEMSGFFSQRLSLAVEGSNFAKQCIFAEVYAMCNAKYKYCNLSAVLTTADNNNNNYNKGHSLFNHLTHTSLSSVC